MCPATRQTGRNRAPSENVRLRPVAYSPLEPQHSSPFDERAGRTPEAVESWRVSGSFDDVLRAVASGLHDWKRIMSEMMDGGFGMGKIVSNFLMDEMKSFGGYPLGPDTRFVFRVRVVVRSRRGQPGRADLSLRSR